MNKAYFSTFIIILALGVLYYVFLSGKEYHIHADIVISINGETLDLSEEKYQTNHNHSRHSSLHLHDNVGDVLHVHQKDLSINGFLKSLAIVVEGDCVRYRGVSYCEGEENIFKVYVNGEESLKRENYIPKDLDKILVYFGVNEEERINVLINSITENACIQSGKCPERGVGSSESSCGVGSTSGCGAVIPLVE